MAKQSTKGVVVYFDDILVIDGVIVQNIPNFLGTCFVTRCTKE